jgi:pimeloyl-ACP methyl ester carboxylesterase
MLPASSSIYQPLRKARHEKLVLRGVEHHLVRWGPESDDPLVLLHGWADTADTFQFMVDAFLRDWPLAGIDWRGFGRSDWCADGYWFPDYLADLDELLDRLCPQQPACLVGHSMGGNVAMLYAGIRPHRVRRLVSLEGVGLPRGSAEDAPGRYREWLDQLRESPAFSTFASFDELAERLLRRNPRIGAERAGFIARSWARNTAEGGIALVADPAHRRVNPYRYRRDEAEACWRQIAAPTLLLLAGDSNLAQHFPAEDALAGIAAHIPGLRIETVADAGHMLHHEQPAEVARLVEAFLMEES